MSSGSFSLRRSIMVFLAIVVIVILIVSSIDFLVVTSPASPSAPLKCESTNFISNGVTAYSNTTNGLRLVVSIRPVNAPQCSYLVVMAQIYNILSRTVQVNATSMTNPADGLCEQGLITGVRVYQGSPVLGNISEARELRLYNPSLGILCIALGTFRYTFSPNSNTATIQPMGCCGRNTTGPVNETSILTGYWAGTGQNYEFHTFPQGNYTVLVFDAWGQKTIVHFQVGNTLRSV